MNLAIHFLYFCWALKCIFECQVRLGVFDHFKTDWAKILWGPLKLSKYFSHTKNKN